MRRPILSLALFVSLASPAAADEVVVFAAASLKTALDRIATDFQTSTGHSAVSYTHLTLPTSVLV